MAAILDRCVPSRRLERKRQRALQERLDARFGDTHITAPTGGAWNQIGNDMDRDHLPVSFASECGSQDPSTERTSTEQNVSMEKSVEGDIGRRNSQKNNFTITIPLPWPSRKSHTRSASLAHTSTVSSDKKDEELELSPRSSFMSSPEPTPRSVLSSPDPGANSFMSSPNTTLHSRATSPVATFKPVSEEYMQQLLEMAHGINRIDSPSHLAPDRSQNISPTNIVYKPASENFDKEIAGIGMGPSPAIPQRETFSRPRAASTSIPSGLPPNPKTPPLCYSPEPRPEPTGLPSDSKPPRDTRSPELVQAPFGLPSQPRIGTTRSASRGPPLERLGTTRSASRGPASDRAATTRSSSRGPAPDRLGTTRSASRGPVADRAATTRSSSRGPAPDRIGTTRSASRGPVADRTDAPRPPSRSSPNDQIPTTRSASRGPASDRIPTTRSASRGPASDRIPTTRSASRGPASDRIGTTRSASRGPLLSERSIHAHAATAQQHGRSLSRGATPSARIPYRESAAYSSASDSGSGAGSAGSGISLSPNPGLQYVFSHDDNSSSSNGNGNGNSNSISNGNGTSPALVDSVTVSEVARDGESGKGGYYGAAAEECQCRRIASDLEEEGERERRVRRERETEREREREKEREKEKEKEKERKASSNQGPQEMVPDADELW